MRPPGPDLRINTRPLAAPMMGPPVISTGAPIATPNTPNVHAPHLYPSQAAPQMGCPPMLGADPATDPAAAAAMTPAKLSMWARIPLWAKVLGGVTLTSVAVGLIVYFARRGGSGSI